MIHVRYDRYGLTDEGAAAGLNGGRHTDSLTADMLTKTLIEMTI